MNPTSKPAKVNINGKQHELHFNLNAFDKFEETSGQFFLDFLMDMQSAMKEAAAAGENDDVAKMAVMRKLSLKKVRALLHAALHYYDKNDEPVWPYTPGQLGKMIDAANMGNLLPALWDGANNNLPEAAPKQEGEPDRPTTGVSAPPPSNGGEQFGPSDEDVSNLLTPVSAG